MLGKEFKVQSLAFAKFEKWLIHSWLNLIFKSPYFYLLLVFWKGGYLGNFFKNMGRHVYISNYSEHFESVKFWRVDTLYFFRYLGSVSSFCKVWNFLNPFLIKLGIQVALLLSIIRFRKGGDLGNFLKIRAGMSTFPIILNILNFLSNFEGLIPSKFF